MTWGLYLALGLAWGLLFARYVYWEVLAPAPRDRSIAEANARLRREHPLWAVRGLMALLLIATILFSLVFWPALVAGQLRQLYRRHA